MDPVAAKYAELSGAGLPSQFCLTWCRIHDPEEVARAFGATPGTGVWATPEEQEELEEEHPGELLQLSTAGAWTIAFEPGGLQGVRSDEARNSASRPTRSAGAPPRRRRGRPRNSTRRPVPSSPSAMP